METGDGNLDQDVSLADGKQWSNSRKTLKVTGFRNKQFGNHNSLYSSRKLRSKWHSAFY